MSILSADNAFRLPIGWICPRCDTAHAPGVLRCDCLGSSRWSPFPVILSGLSGTKVVDELEYTCLIDRFFAKHPHARSCSVFCTCDRCKTEI